MNSRKHKYIVNAQSKCIELINGAQIPVFNKC